MKRMIPPVAVPFGVGTIAATVIASRGGGTAVFAAELAQRFGAVRVELFGSGRSALALLISSARRPARDEVLIPAYTCWSVPASAVRAGCRVKLYDIDPATFLPGDDLGREVGQHDAAVVIADLLSPAHASASIASDIAGRHPDVLVIEDRAQSWMPEAKSESVTLLSFGRGKPLPLGGGGALLLHSGSDRVISAAVRGGGFGTAVGLAAATLLGRPATYGIPASIPRLGLGKTRFDPSFDVLRPFRHWQSRLGFRVLPRMDELKRRRSHHARALARTVESAAGWRVGPWSDGPIRLPVFGPSRRARDYVSSALARRGISASTLYPGTLLDIPALRPHLSSAPREYPGAREIADLLLTLPVYPTLTPSEVAYIGAAFLRAAEEARR